jgi:hypothetical protein
VAKFTVNDSGAKRKLKDVKERITRSSLIATEGGAKVIQHELRKGVGFRTGRLRDAIIRRKKTHKLLEGKWQVRILASRFPSFFYAILFFDLYRDILRKATPIARSRIRTLFHSSFRKSIPTTRR